MKVLRSVDEEFWIDVADRCAFATFFHTPFWHGLARTAVPGSRDRSVGIVLDTGVRVVFPLLETGRSLKGVFSHLVSGALGCYGGPIADERLSAAEVTLVHDVVRKTRLLGTLKVTENPFSPYELPRSEDNSRDSTRVLDIGGRTIEELVRAFSSSHRRALRKGRRMGVSVSRAETLRDFETYFDAYEASLNRWGDAATSRYPWEVFRAVWRLAQQEPGIVQLWLAKVDSEFAAGALLFRWNHHCVYWHGAAYERFFSYRAPTVLFAGVLEHCIENDVQLFDFNPSGGHEGVENFKRGFGAVNLGFARSSYRRRTFDVCHQAVSSLTRRKR